MSIEWGSISNIEISLKDFLKAAAIVDSLTVDIDVADDASNTWTLPRIVIDNDSDQDPRAELGSNKRFVTPLIIIDIHARNAFERNMISSWVKNEINDGFEYYKYSSDPTERDVPLKTQTGHVSFDYVSSQKVRLGDDVNDYDKWRYRISIKAWVIGTI